MKFKVSALQTSILIFALCLLMFRPAFIAKFGAIGQITALAPILVWIILIPFVRLRSNQLFLLITPLYFLGLGIVHSISSYQGNYLPALAGLYAIIFPYLFWLFMIKLPALNKETIDLFLIYVALINVAGAIVFFFYDPLVFGWVGESVYSDSAKMAVGNIDLRARTFIGTPQTVGVYAAVMLFASYSNTTISRKFKFACVGLLFILGLLSGSKSFYLSLLAILVAFSALNGVRVRYLLLCLCIPGLLVVWQDVAGIFGRVVGIVGYLETGISKHATYIAWAEVLNYLQTNQGLIFGQGLGALSRAGQLYYTSGLSFTTAESFILQILFESGLLGLLMLLTSIAYLLICSLKSKDYANFALGMGIFVNMFVSPSFYGSAFGFLGYYYLFSSQYRLSKTT